MKAIISAMDEELDNILNAMENKTVKSIAGKDYYTGLIYGSNVVCVKCGIGKVNSAVTCAVLLEHFDIDLVINTGIAGGYMPLQTRDIVLADSITYSDVDVRAFGYELGQVPGMPKEYKSSITYLDKIKKYYSSNNIDYVETKLYSSDVFVTKDTVFPFDFPKEGAAVEMEGASIAQTCYLFNTPFLSIRFISDIVDSENHLEDYNKFEHEMALSSANTLLNLVKNKII